MLKEYKIYAIKDRKTLEIKYIGLTRQTLYKRFSGHVYDRKISPKDYFIELILENLTLEEAATLEKMYIAQYNLLETGWNKSPGSINGCSNYHSEAQKKKWSEERKGKPIKGRITREGYKNSASHNQRIVECNSKKIICLNDGKVYDSLRKAAKELGLSESKVSNVCRGKRPHTKGYKFKYI